MRARLLVGLAASVSIGCGARTGLLEPPPAAIDAGTRDALVDDAIERDVADAAPADTRVDAADTLDTLDALDTLDTLDAPEVVPPIVELALLVEDSSIPSGLALVLADATTGAILRRGVPVTVSGATETLVSPDTHRALVVPRGLPGDVHRFDVATAAGMKIPVSDFALAAHWSHDGAHVCMATDPSGLVLDAAATDGGTAIPVPSSAFPGDCSWSHDDAYVAWSVGPQVFVTKSTGGAALEVTGAASTDDRFQLAGWSPTEERIAFALHDRSAGWRAFTTLVGDARIEIDDVDVSYVAGWSSDGKSLAYTRATPPPIATSVRSAPAAGPVGATVEIVAPTRVETSPFTLSDDGRWFAYDAVDSGPSTAGSIVVASFAPGSAIVTPVTDGVRPYVWSSRDVLAFADDASGAGVFVVDPSAGAAKHVGAALKDGEGIDGLTWSSDGATLAYARTSGASGAGASSICLVSMSDLSERCPGGGLDGGAPVWSHDGTRIAFQSAGGVSILSIATMTVARVPVDPFATLSYWWVRP